MRDGNSEESPLMARFCGKSNDVPAILQTTQNSLRIRWWRHRITSNLNKLYWKLYCIHRFSSNYYDNGLGFHLEYESTNITQWSYSYGECGGNFTTQNGILTSPSHPDNYPNNANCVYTVSQPAGTIIVITFHSMDIETCPWYHFKPDYLEIRDGSSSDSIVLTTLCGNNIPAPIYSNQNQVWMKWG